MDKRVITILGCTASGKGTLARGLAGRLGGEIVSIDSMKVYRGMDIGTAKPGPAERAAVPHHLIDIADPWEHFSAARFVELADRAVAGIHSRNRPAVAVGGTILYFKGFYQGFFEGPPADARVRAEIRRRAEVEGLSALHAELARVDPDAAARIHPNDLRRIERALEVHQLTGTPISRLQQQWTSPTHRRPEWNWTLISLRQPREEVNRRINERVRRMIAAGLVEEARRIWSDTRGVGAQASQAVGYAELFEHFTGRLSLEDAIERIKINSRRLSKHQRSWLKRLEDVCWIDVEESDDVAGLLSRVSAMLD